MGFAVGEAEVIGENLGECKIIVVIPKNCLFMRAAVVEVVIASFKISSLVVSTGHFV